jgi:hypothetical protein
MKALFVPGMWWEKALVTGDRLWTGHQINP